MNLLLRPVNWMLPTPYPKRPAFTFERVPFDDIAELDDDDIIPIIVAIYERGWPT